MTHSDHVSDASSSKAGQPTSSSRLARMLPVLIPFLALVLAFLHIRPETLGAFQDDALYHDMACSWLSPDETQASGSQASLPFAPQLSKYPPLYPLLLSLPLRLVGADSAWSLSLLFAFQALLFALLCHLFINVLLPRFDCTAEERLLAFGLFAIHNQCLATLTGLLSESLYLILLLLQLELLFRLGLSPSSPSKTETESSVSWPGLLSLAALSALAAWTRSVAVLTNGALLLALLSWRRWRLAAAVLLGLLLAMGLSRGAKQQALEANAEKLGPAKSVMAYYLDYNFHLKDYKQALKRGDLRGLGGRALEVSAGNFQKGFSALGRCYSPRAVLREVKQQPDGGTWLPIGLGLALWLGALWGFREAPWGRVFVLILLIVPVFFLFWTWIFSVRFWIPLLPLLMLGLLLAARPWPRPARAVLAALVVTSALSQCVLIGMRIQSPRRAQWESLAAGPEKLYHEHFEWFKAHSSRSRGDVLVGGFSSFWLSKQTGLPALWASTLLPREPFLKLGRGQPVTLDRSNAQDFVENIGALRARMPKDALLFVWLDESMSAPCRAVVAELASSARLVPLRISFGAQSKSLTVYIWRR